VRILKAGAIYFALVFAAGFALGTVRVLLIVPRIGAMVVELAETPIMFVANVFAARWLTRRLAFLSAPVVRLGACFTAFGPLLLNSRKTEPDPRHPYLASSCSG